MDSFGERGDVNPLIGRVVAAEIKGLTSPARQTLHHFFLREEVLETFAGCKTTSTVG